MTGQHQCGYMSEAQNAESRMKKGRAKPPTDQVSSFFILHSAFTCVWLWVALPVALRVCPARDFHASAACSLGVH
jgi:hypothetical protein